MKVFENKGIIKKSAIIVLVIIIVSFLFSGNVKASSDGIGGKLLKPVIDLVLGLGDGVYDIVHKVIFNQDVTLLHIDLTTGFWENLWETISTIGVFVLAAVAAAAVIIATAGLASGLVAALTGVTLGSLGVGTVLAVSVAAGTIAVSVYNSTFYPDDEIVLPLYSISPEEIFSNEIVIFDVDFFNSEKTKTLKDEEGNDIIGDDGKPIELESTAKKLKNVVSNWYIVLRDISLVALLSVLVYIGIKILISSTSGDKAKYKEMLKDWIVAICLLFVMQYIMSFSNLLVEKFTDLVKGVNYSDKNLEMIADKDGKVSENLKENYGYTDEQLESLYAKTDEGDYMKDENDDKYIYWNTDLVGRARLSAQMGQQYSATYAGYTVIFLVLVFYTIFFIVTYLKRIIYMAFLTIIAPLVALTYPIDKINDGKAQAFDMWFKEYIFNLLIQPMHLILYTILVTSAFELASSNMLYSLVALGFMIPAEKLLRKFFGFEKAQTPGLLAGPAGAAVMMSGMNKLLSVGKSKTSKNSGNKLTSANMEDGKSNIKYKDLDSDGILGDKDNTKAMKNVDGIGTNNEKGLAAENQYIEDKIKNKFNNAKLSIGNKAGDLRTAFDNTPTGQALAYKKLSATNKMRKLKNKSRLINAGVGATKYYARGMQNKIGNKIKNGELGKKAIRTVGGVALGGVAATGGLALGIASGDPSKTLQYAATGALGGYRAGGIAADNIRNMLEVDGTTEEASKAYFGDEQYEERQRQKYIKEKQKDFDFQNRMIKAMNGDEEKARQVINDVFPTCAEYGFVEPEEVSAIHDMVDKEGYDTKQALAWAQKAKKYGKDTNYLSAKDDKEYNETLRNNYIKKGYSEEKAGDMAKNVRDGVDKYNKYLYKRKK